MGLSSSYVSTWISERLRNGPRKKERIDPVIEVLEDLDSTDDEDDNIPMEGWFQIL